MTDDVVPEIVRELINERLPSMDHVEVLLMLYGAPTVDHDPVALIDATRLAPTILHRVVDELTRAELVVAGDAGYRFCSAANIRTAVSALAALYHTRPVTLVRAIYARPSSVSSFNHVLRPRPQPDP
jgi:hypothetical protein